MSRILILFAHLAIDRSKINRTLLDAVGELAGVTVHDLLERYPDFYIDVDAEQALLRRHDLLVFQHPIYWYGVPAIVKHWLDSVLTRGFAYGPGGSALHGKGMLMAVSTGASAAAYEPDGPLGITVEELLKPMAATARFSGMRYLEPLVVHGNYNVPAEHIPDAARRYRERLLGYLDTPPDRSEA